MKTTKKIYGLAPALPVALVLMCGLGATLNAQNLYVGPSSTGIGEYGLDGSTVNRSLIPLSSFPGGIAISGNSLFVVSSNSIGEYTTSGATVNASLITGLDIPTGIAVWGNALYVVNEGNGTVGEYTTSGGTVNASLISDLSFPSSIAIGPVPEPSTVALAIVGAAALWLRRRRK
jgi:PEP-CTERM motif